MEITHLVTAGCSWTYCQGLDDPKTQGWPALLANKLGVPVVNLALPGLGNDAIHRLTYEYFFQDLPNKSKPLYVIGWTQPWRREAWCRSLYKHPTIKLPPGYSIIAMPDKIPKNNLERALLDTWSEEDFYRKTMLYRLSLDALFKSRNIPNVNSFFATEWHDDHVYDEVKAKYATIHEYLCKSTNELTMFTNIVRDCPPLPCGHDGYEAMPILANFIYNELISMYKEIIPVAGNYMTLKEFTDIDTTGNIESVWK